MTAAEKAAIIAEFKAALHNIRAVIEVLEECGTAPASILYLDFQARGYGLPYFERLMELACATGQICKVGGHSYRKTTAKERFAYDQHMGAEFDALTANPN